MITSKKNRTNKKNIVDSLRIKSASPSKWKGDLGCKGLPPRNHRLAGGGTPPTTQRSEREPPAAPTDTPPNDDIRAGASL